MSGAYDWPLGTLLVGVYLNTYLYGIVSFRFASYFSAGFDDRTWLRSIVAALCVIDTTQVASVMYMMYIYLIKHFGDQAVVAVPLWPYPFTALTNAMSASLVQVVLGYRIYRLTGDNNFIYSGLLFYCLVVFAIGTTASLRAWTIDQDSGYPELVILNDIVAAWHCLEVGLDVTITVMLTVILTRARTGFRRTDTIINRLIRGAVQTGLLGSLVSLATVVAFIRSPHTNLYGLFAMFHGRIYSNTLMDTLMARETIRTSPIASNILETSPSQSMWGSRDTRIMTRPEFSFQVHSERRDMYKHSVAGHRSAGRRDCGDLQSANSTARQAAQSLVNISAFEDEHVPTPRPPVSSRTPQ